MLANPYLTNEKAAANTNRDGLNFVFTTRNSFPKEQNSGFVRDTSAHIKWCAASPPLS